ncbi:MAG: hypothetical protein Q8S20_06195 [Sulfuritalea sp.]|nr:hypothetical protein [Sulfuritalea sp.]
MTNRRTIERNFLGRHLVLLTALLSLELLVDTAFAQTVPFTQFTCVTNLPIHPGFDDPMVTGPNSIACGTRAVAGTGGSAFGDQATAVGLGATAIGQGANAVASNSVAIGSGSVADAPNTVSVGSPGNERRITNVAAGINQTDAVNVAQLQNMSADFQSRFDAVSKDIQNVSIESRRGIAAVAAMSNTPMPSAPGRTTWTVNTSYFQNETGAGFAFAHRLNTPVPLAITVGFGTGGGRQNVVRAGLMGEF